MHIKMSDFFMGMGRDFTMEVLDIAEKLAQQEKDVLFREGEPARHFYVLLKGRVKLSLGDSGPVVYMVRQPGEIIGWSGLIAPHTAAANARALTPCEVISISRKPLQAHFETDWQLGYLMVQKAAVVVRDRLRDLRLEVASLQETAGAS